MTDQITLEEALKLVDFEFIEGEWCVGAVKGNCGVVEGNCAFVEGDCHIVEGDCCIVRGNCLINVFGTINGHRWQYVETSEDN